MLGILLKLSNCEWNKFMKNGTIKVSDYRRKKPMRIHLYKTKLQVFMELVWKRIKQIFWTGVVVGAICLVYIYGHEMGEAGQKPEIINVVQADNGVAPILSKIADCESGERLSNGKAKKGSASHYGKNGQVNVYGNKNATVDIGKYMVNSYYWGKKATEMGLDIWKEVDNEKMAIWIYENEGTEPWSSSYNCWK